MFYKDRVCVPNDYELKKAMLENMLKGYVIDHEGSWDRHIPFVKIVYNNSFQSRIGMAPYEAYIGEKM